MKGGTAVLISLLILIVLGLGGFAFYLWQNQEKTPDQAESISDLVLENQEAGWQTFTSPLGYSITYPSNYFKAKNENENSDLFVHEVGSDSVPVAAGSIYMKRQETNIKDLDRLYNVISENLEKTNEEGAILRNELKNRKDLVLEDGTKLIEFDQNGVEEYHNIILLNGGYVYNLGYKSKNADTVQINYFNKMYPSIKFTTGGVAKENWELQTATAVGITYRLPPKWVTQETAKEISIISPNQNLLTISRERTLSLDSGGKKFLLNVGGSEAEITLTVDKNNLPSENSRGYGHINNAIFFTLNFKTKSESTREADWSVIQEIIKSIDLEN